MQTLRVGQGYTRSWTVQLRDAQRREVEDVYSGSETLAVVVDDGAGDPVTLAGSGAAWLDAAAGTLTLTLDNSDTATIPPGRYGLSITLAVGGEPLEAFRAVLAVEARPD